MKSVLDFDIVIVGAGVIGCALANKLSKRFSVCVLEMESNIGEGVSSRNSGVIHAGLYYPPSSLKAILCVKGNPMLYSWCKAKNVPYSKMGKLIVSRSSNTEKEMASLIENARLSGAYLEMLSSRQLKQKEPDIKVDVAIFSPATGIVDPFELSKSLFLSAKENGCEFVFNQKVDNCSKERDRYIIELKECKLRSQMLINSTGLYSDEFAHLLDVSQYKIYPYRGNYFRFKSAQKFRHLIYPLRKKGEAGLGVHLTIDLSWQYRLGPDVELSESKIDFSDRPELLESFRAAAENLLGLKISSDQLHYDTCGIRPKLRAPTEDVERDFVIKEDLKGLINLVGIESPGLTSCLAIADHVSGMI